MEGAGGYVGGKFDSDLFLGAVVVLFGSCGVLRGRFLGRGLYRLRLVCRDWTVNRWVGLLGCSVVRSVCRMIG